MAVREGGVMSGSPGAVAVLRVCAVLRDCADQLAVLGHLMAGTHRDTTAAAAAAAAATEASENIGTVLEQQRDAELHLEAARGGQAEGQVEGRGVSEGSHELHRTQELEHALMDRNICFDSMTKVQSDQRFVARLVTELLTELKEEGTFYSLILTMEEEKRTKAQLDDLIIREEEDGLRIKALQKQLLDIRNETTLQTQERDKMVAYLEDQLQEWKMKKRLQEKYVNNSTQLLVHQGQKLNSHIEKQLEDEIEMLKTKLMEEETAHKELEVFLEKTKTSLEEKLEYWSTRYDEDTEDKQQELNTAKSNVSNNRAQLQELATKYRDSEQVIIEDRLEKENLRKQLEKEQLQGKAAIKIQSWWRGTLVRKGLGPFKKAKNPKPIKGDKKAKKK